jgi:hypothetical protein
MGGRLSLAACVSERIIERATTQKMKKAKGDTKRSNEKKEERYIKVKNEDD